MGRDLEAELRGHDGEWPAAWKPREGEILVGVVQLYSTGQSAYGPVRTVIVQRTDGSRVSVWLSQEVLRREFEGQSPKVGERIGLKFHGKHPTRGYGRYTLLVDREEDQSFAPLGGEHGDVEEGDDDHPFGSDPMPPYATATVSRPSRRG